MEAYGEVVAWLQRPAVAEMVIDMVLCVVPIWTAVMIGLVIGWSWRPRWTGLLFLSFRSRLRLLYVPPGLGAHRLWLAFTAFSALSVCLRQLLSSAFRGRSKSAASAVSRSSSAESIVEEEDVSGTIEDEVDVVNDNDLEHLLQLLDSKDGDAAWQNQMERTTSNMAYQSWRHEPEVGPIVYCSRTVFEDASPELVRDFFWDDDFRLKWDAMLVYFKTLEEFPHNGTTIVHWIKKFPFFCSDREYIIARRVWESGKTYYCVTKGVSHPSLPKKEKPRRVELYFSSWRIRAVESLKQDGRQDGQLSACEVTLIHYEDMGIPQDVAKVGVQHGMWGAVKKLQSGFGLYQQMRRSETELPRSAVMARITTKFSMDGTTGPAEPEPSAAEETEDDSENSKVVQQGFDWKWVVIGGAVATLCVLHTGILGKVILVGAARRQAKKSG